MRNRWKVKRGGLRTYGYYDFHWGKEDNVFQTPNGYNSKVRHSIAGQVLKEMDFRDEHLKKNKIKSLRKSARVQCSFNSDTENIEVQDGFVKKSSDFLCSDYCIYDILNDPCELSSVDNKKILNKAVKLLNKYKRNLRPQEDNSVDPLSDPKRRGGAWMPWLSTNYEIFSYPLHENLPLKY